MGQISRPAAVKLFIGILTSLPAIIPEVESCLRAKLGAIDLRSGEFPFDLTRYYEEEMGSPIIRLFVAFETLFSPAQLAIVKTATNDLEAEFAARQTGICRPVNLDPGYLEESKIVLASTKNFYHRILLADGIYGEVTLHYSKHAWQAFPWSFPDFRSGRYDEFFTNLRRVYKQQLRKDLPRSGVSED
ncbi:MAG: DUF4416 family protein [Acidobacteriota bacterium]|jgi:hypothetical protein